jgi:hypothetical protein
MLLNFLYLGDAVLSPARLRNEVQMIRKIPGALIVLLLSFPGPVVADTAFSCPDPGSVKLNETTRDEIEGAHPYGSQSGSFFRNGETVEIITYTQTSVRKSLAAAKKVTPARALSFYFLDGILVGYEFVSSFKEDHTDFDDAKLSEIKKGETKIEDVEELLGKVCGQHVFPLVSSDVERALVYAYTQVKGSFKLTIYTKTLLVTLDSNGVVMDVSLQSSGKR